MGNAASYTFTDGSRSSGGLDGFDSESASPAAPLLPSICDDNESEICNEDNCREHK